MSRSLLSWRRRGGCSKNSLVQRQVRDQRQMVRRHQRRLTPMPRQPLQPQLPIEVDVIQSEDREASRERAGLLQVIRDIRLVEVLGQPRGHRPAEPFIEVSEDDAGPVELLVDDDALVDEFPRLLELLEESGAEVDVEDVQGGVGKPDVGTQAAAVFASASRADVVVPVMLDREPGQDDISVTSTVVPLVFAESEIEAELLGDKPGLVFLAAAALPADNFLQGNDIRA